MNKYERYKKVDLPWLEKVPEHWELGRISRIFNLRKEKNNPIVTQEVLSLSAKYGVSPYSEKKEKGGNKPKEDLRNYNICYPGDILVNCMNIVAGSVGISNYLGAVSPVYYPLVNQNFDLFSTRYMEYLLRTYNFQRSLVGLGKGIQMSESEDGRLFTVRMRISWDMLKTQLLLIPPLVEQEQIADYLDWKINEIDRLIIVEKEKILELQRLLSTKVDRIFDDLLRVSVSKIRMRFLYEFQNGISTSKDYTNGEFPFLTYSDVYNNLIVPEKLGGRINSDGKEQEIYSIDEGDLFVTRTSERIEDAGKVSLALHKVENAVFNGFTIRLRPKANNNFLAKFILYYLNSAIVREKIINSLNLVTRVSIKQEILKEVSVPVVSIEDQQYTVESIEELSNTFQSEIASLQSKINYFSSLKHSLISEVVTGKIDVRNVVIPIYEKVDVSVSTDEEEIEE